MVIAGTVSGQPGEERGLAGDVHALLGLGHRAAEDHVVHRVGLEARDGGDGRADRVGGQGVGAGVLELAAEGAGEGVRTALAMTTRGAMVSFS